MPLSNKQMEYLALAWQCFETEPKIDYEKFKSVAGLASAASARELVRVTKKKLKEEYGALSGSIQAANVNTSATKPKQTAPRTPSSGTKRKKATSEVSDDLLGVHGEETPSKRTKKSGGKENGVKAEPVAEEESDGGEYLV